MEPYFKILFFCIIMPCMLDTARYEPLELLCFLLNVPKSQGFDCSFTWATSQEWLHSQQSWEDNTLQFLYYTSSSPRQACLLTAYSKSSRSPKLRLSPGTHLSAYAGSIGPSTLPCGHWNNHTATPVIPFAAISNVLCLWLRNLMSSVSLSYLLSGRQFQPAWNCGKLT